MQTASLKTPKKIKITSEQYASGGTSTDTRADSWNVRQKVPQNVECTVYWSGQLKSNSTQSQWQKLSYTIGKVSGKIAIKKTQKYATVTLSGQHKALKTADGGTPSGSQWWAQLTITYAFVKWGAQSVTGTTKKKQETSSYNLYDFDIPGQFPHKGQIAYIVDKYGGPVDDDGNKTGILVKFDGVIKCSVSSQIKTDDQKNHEQKKNNKYINNAMDQPDQVTLQVIESSVYTNQSYFEGGQTDDRMMFTYQYLYQLKKSRRMVDVWTGINLYENMLLKSISVTLDEKTSTINNENAFSQKAEYQEKKSNGEDVSGYSHNSFLNGWAGQLTFHQFWKPISDDDEDTSGTDTDKRSQMAKLFGDGWI